jgi:tetratricopeptide (TPR) repeat protein
LIFGERCLAILRVLPDRALSGNELVPDAAIFAQAHQLVGQACLWTGELERAGSCFSLAYRFFERLGDELGLAKVEQLESQRRFFVGNGAQALVLASRARRTAEQLGVEDEAARCRVAEGMALQRLNRHAEAVESFQSSLPVFERFDLWSNYVGAVNATATSLVVLGRPDEARRQFAKALRRLSRDQHRSWLPFIRKGLAEVLFSVGRYREAAISAAQAARQYADCGMRSRSLLSSLFEVESWARAGESGRALHRLTLFRSEIAREGIHDPTLFRLIREIFAGSKPDFQMIAELRRSAEKTLPQGLGEMNA